MRVDWVDYAKGVCIILVVMMHSTLGVEKAVGHSGHLSAFIEWARPFRMPDFFLISGLFLQRRIHQEWRSYLDSKVLHFAYFYVLWMTIQLLFKGAALHAEGGFPEVLRQYLLAFIDPFGTLWFIYLLAIFFVVTKATRHIAPHVIFLFAAALEMAPIQTGWMVIDEFAGRFVYFFAGYWLANVVFQSTARMWMRHTLALLAGLYIWAVGHTMAVRGGMADLPLMSLALGLAGAGAVITFSVVLARSRMVPWLRWLGENSIVIYLSFFLFMAATRSLGLKLVPTAPVDFLSLLTTTAAICGSVVLFLLTRNTAFSFLFRRPQWARLKTMESRPQGWHSAGHEHPLQQQRPQTRRPPLPG